jgi:hypothetical protein
MVCLSWRGCVMDSLDKWITAIMFGGFFVLWWLDNK